MNDEPKTIPEYVVWARAELNDDLELDATKRIYETNAATALSSIQRTEFVRKLASALAEGGAEYSAKTASTLRMNDDEVEFSTKPFTSVVNKLFRQNVVWNKKFPKAPDGGWLTSRDVYSRLDDLVRATIVCKFLDGPEFLADKISTLATSLGLSNDVRSLERDDGYYAFHAYITFPVELTDASWAVKHHMLAAEIQITTQLQEVLRGLTHRYYEQVRLERAPDKKQWKWRSSDPRFRAGFLSHSLHLLEGLILELRDAEE